METLLLDTSYLGEVARVRRGGQPLRSFTPEIAQRLQDALLAISPFTIAEVRAGWAIAGWGERRIVEAQHELDLYLQIPLDPTIVDEWARLRAHARSMGHDGISHNDLWIAATACARSIPLVACDGDFAKIRGALTTELVWLPPDGS
jgi:predicted nucleic acid-binding protein